MNWFDGKTDTCGPGYLLTQDFLSPSLSSGFFLRNPPARPAGGWRGRGRWRGQRFHQAFPGCFGGGGLCHCGGTHRVIGHAGTHGVQGQVIVFLSRYIGSPTKCFSRQLRARAPRLGRAIWAARAVQMRTEHLMIQLSLLRMVQHQWNQDSFSVTQLTKFLLWMSCAYGRQTSRVHL